MWVATNIICLTIVVISMVIMYSQRQEADMLTYNLFRSSDEKILHVVYGKNNLAKIIFLHGLIEIEGIHKSRHQWNRFFNVNTKDDLGRYKRGSKDFRRMNKFYVEAKHHYDNVLIPKNG